MSVSFWGGLRIGMLFTKDDLFKEGVQRKACRNDHLYPSDTKAKFCPECGQPLKVDVAGEPRFRCLAGQNPDTLVGEWNPKMSHGVGFFSPLALQSCEDKCQQYVFGIELYGIRESYGKSAAGVPDIQQSAVVEAAARVVEEATKLDLPIRDVKLFPYLYVSY